MSNLVENCPPNCGGCACHISPLCSHCENHLVEITDEDIADTMPPKP